MSACSTDERRFKQVTLNLLSNAVKFTPEGGEVVVSAARDGGELVVTVTDNGIGIAAQDHERIFESFQQSGRSTPCGRHRSRPGPHQAHRRAVRRRDLGPDELGAGRMFGMPSQVGEPAEAGRPGTGRAAALGDGGPLVVS